MIKLVISTAPITKKNHQRILWNRKTGKRFIAQSEQYEDYEKLAKYLLEGQYKDEPIDYKVNVKCLYYMPTKRKVDLLNLMSATHDILTYCNILKDDNSNIIESVDGSRVLYDRNNPRTEIYIEPIGGEQSCD